MKYKLTIVIFTFFIIQHCFSQNMSQFSVGQLKAMGKNHMKLGYPLSAIDYFEAYMAKKTDNAEVMFLLAEAYRATRDYSKAQKWYKKAYQTNPDKYLAAQYYWGTMLMAEKKYTEASDILNKFKKASQGGSLEELNKLSKKQIEGCRFALSDTGAKVIIVHLDSLINSSNVELSPMFVDNNTMVYSSLCGNSRVNEASIDSTDTFPVRKFYVAKRNGSDWKFKSNWDDIPLSSDMQNVGNGAFSPDGKRFYFTRCERNWKSQMICKILQSTKEENGKWSVPVELPESINDPKFTSTQPAVATYSKRDDEILYFVSNRDGGRGGLDIWYSQFKNKTQTWSEPKNCGSKINTEGDETTPFIDMENSTMFFSSNGWGGLGELDVYKSAGELTKWMPLENLKAPVNSSYDDFYYTLDKNLFDGFLVSNRPGDLLKGNCTCCDDIYSLKYNEVVRIKTIGKIYGRIDKKFKKLFGGGSEDEKYKSDSSYKLAQGVPVTLFLIDETAPMGAGNMIYVKSDSIDADGNFSFNLEAGKEYVVEVENYGFFNQRYNLSTLLYTQSDTMYLDTIGIDIMPKEPIVVENVYYEFGDTELSRKARRAIDSTLLTLLLDNAEIIIEISSHTDNKGRDKFNKELSQKRAEGVAKYLIKQGIAKERLYAKGYGEERPIAPNELSNGDDNAEGRKLNRRTEFKIIGSLDQYTELNIGE